MDTERKTISLTENWGDRSSVSLYLDKGQVDTPHKLVKSTWEHVHQLRPSIGKVVDFGAGDGRFAGHGKFDYYIGLEIDTQRCVQSNLPPNAEIQNKCAFSVKIDDADLCIGNPPFVRNQDLPMGWRENASKIVLKRTGVAISGLANSWQYFFLLALGSVKIDGLCALIVPFEWVSRPSVKALRNYIKSNDWNVEVYRLMDKTFSGVLTTSSITIVDKARKRGTWSFFQESADGKYSKIGSPSGSAIGVIKYSEGSNPASAGPRAVRGLSPGTQKVFTLTEGERVHFGLKTGRDVVACVTTLRHLPASVKELDEINFRDYYVNAGKKCWLIVTQTEPSDVLEAYIRSVLPNDYGTKTCLARKQWWKFNLPQIPKLLFASGFRGKFPKYAANKVGARAVGTVCGIYNMTESQVGLLTAEFMNKDISNRIVSHSNGLRKIEINQLNTLLDEVISPKI